MAGNPSPCRVRTRLTSAAADLCLCAREPYPGRRRPAPRSAAAPRSAPPAAFPWPCRPRLLTSPGTLALRPAGGSLQRRGQRVSCASSETLCPEARDALRASRYPSGAPGDALGHSSLSLRVAPSPDTGSPDTGEHARVRARAFIDCVGHGASLPLKGRGTDRASQGHHSRPPAPGPSIAPGISRVREA